MILEILLVLIIIISTLFIVGVYQKYTNAICNSKKRLDKKTVIVTGGTAGMGLEIAKDFARRGARVIIACPYVEEGLDAKNQIIQSSGNGNVVFKILDLALLESTRKFATEILEHEDRLDILVNNAGVGIPGDFLTADGMNFIMQVNYFGTFLLSLLLLPLLMRTGKPSEPSRIVNTSSILHRVGKVEIQNMNKVNYYYSLIRVYGNSKLSLLLFSRELSNILLGTNVVVNCVDPGVVGTGIYQSWHNTYGKLVSFILRTLFKTPWQGAQTALHVSLDEGAGKVSGKFFKNCRLTKAASQAYDDKKAKELWEESIRMTNISNSELKCFK